MEKSADTDKPTNATDCPIFKDRYDDPISYDGNPACIPGVMHEIELHIKRTGQYQLLFEHRAVPLSNGGLAIDQADNISFIEKRYPNAPTYDFDNPCPPTDARLHEYNVMALSSTPRRTIATPTNTPVPKEQSRNYIASEHKVKEQLRSLMGSLAQCFIDRDAAHSIIEDSDGDGFKFLELWRADLKNAKPSDRALVTTKRDNAYTHGFEGELNIDSLNKFIKDFRILERRCPPESRKSDAEMMTLVNTTMLTNDSTRNAFEQLLMLSSPPIDTYDGTLKAARSMLRTRQNYVEMDAAKAKSSQFGGLPALTAAHIAALASISIDASRLPVSDAITMAESIITQNAALAAAVDPSKTVKGGKGKDKGKGKGGKGKGKGGKGKGKGASTATAPAEFVIPRDENGKVSGWTVGMSHCWCKAAGLDDGKHIYEHCKYDENGKLKASSGTAAIAAVAPAAASTDSNQQIAAIAAAAKKYMESQTSSDSTSETLHAKSAVITPPESIDGIMDDAAMTEELSRFWAMSAEQKAGATKVKISLPSSYGHWWQSPLSPPLSQDSTGPLAQFLATLLSRK